MTVLVTAASKHGATREIAEAIARVLGEHGVSAEFVDLDESATRSPRGGGARQRRLPGALADGSAALRRCPRDELAERPTWLFSSGPIVGDPPRSDPADEAAGQRALEATHAREHKLFAGKLDKGKLGLLEKGAVRAAHASEGDYRDWDEIERWAVGIAAQLRTPTEPAIEEVIDVSAETLIKNEHRAWQTLVPTPVLTEKHRPRPARRLWRDSSVRRWLLAWLGAPVLAIINGAVRELAYKDQVGDSTANQISVAPLIALLALFFGPAATLALATARTLSIGRSGPLCRCSSSSASATTSRAIPGRTCWDLRRDGGEPLDPHSALDCRRPSGRSLQSPASRGEHAGTPSAEVVIVGGGMGNRGREEARAGVG